MALGPWINDDDDKRACDPLGLSDGTAWLMAYPLYLLFLPLFLPALPWAIYKNGYAGFIDWLWPDYLAGYNERQELVKVAQGYSRSWSSQWL